MQAESQLNVLLNVRYALSETVSTDVVVHLSVANIAGLVSDAHVENPTHKLWLISILEFCAISCNKIARYTCSFCLPNLICVPRHYVPTRFPKMLFLLTAPNILKRMWAHNECSNQVTLYFKVTFLHTLHVLTIIVTINYE